MIQIPLLFSICLTAFFYFSVFDSNILARSPLYTHISATFSGLTTIRAFDKESKILEEFYTCQDYQAEAWIMFLRCVRWFCYRLDLFATVFGNIAVLAPVIASRYTCRFFFYIDTIIYLYRICPYLHNGH